MDIDPFILKMREDVNPVGVRVSNNLSLNSKATISERALQIKLRQSQTVPGAIFRGLAHEVGEDQALEVLAELYLNGLDIFDGS